MIEVNSFDAFMKMMVGDPEGRKAGHLTRRVAFGSISCVRIARFPPIPALKTATERSPNAAFTDCHNAVAIPRAAIKRRPDGP
jgi:hypothetical protein